MEAYYEHGGGNRTKISLYLSEEDIHNLRLVETYFGSLPIKPSYMDVVPKLVSDIVKLIDTYRTK